MPRNERSLDVRRSLVMLVLCSSILHGASALAQATPAPTSPEPEAAGAAPQTPPEAAPSQVAPTLPMPSTAPQEPARKAAPSAPSPSTSTMPTTPTERTLSAAATASAPTTAPLTDESLVPPGEDERLAPRDVERAAFAAGKGLTVTSKDKRYQFFARAWASIWYQYDNIQNPAFENQNYDEQSFQLRRARLKFGGYMFGEHNKWNIELGVSPLDMRINQAPDANDATRTTPIQDWNLEFDYQRDATVRAGQFKVPYNRQFVTSAAALQFTDLSFATNEFNLGRDDGADVRSDNLGGWDRLRYAVGAFAGKGRDNRNGWFGPAESINDLGTLAVARVDVLPMGMFEDYREADLERTRKFMVGVGAAYAYHYKASFQQGNQGNVFNDGGTANYHNALVDGMLKFRGFSVGFGWFLRHGTRDLGKIMADAMGNAITPDNARNGQGWYAQAGYLIPRLPIELVARDSGVRPEDDAKQANWVNSMEITGGLNWYIARHFLKLQGDYSRLTSPVATQPHDLKDGYNRARLAIVAFF